MTSTSRFIAYNTASSNWIATGPTVAQTRANAVAFLNRAGGNETDEMLLVFDAGANAEHIVDPMQAHRLMRNLRQCPIVWRGSNALPQGLFSDVA